MSLGEYGIDRYKVTSLFQEGPRGPKGADGPVSDGAGQIVVRERIERNITNPAAALDMLVHDVQPGELARFGDSILIMHYVSGTGVAFPTTGYQLRWRNPLDLSIDSLLASVSTSPVNGVMHTEIQADPWNANYMYRTSSPGQLFTTRASRVSIGEDWITKGGQLYIRCTIAAGATASFVAVYMTKRESI
jgi:hypothetical protein